MYGLFLSIRYRTGGTYTGAAINTMVSDLFGNGTGARDSDENVPRVGIVMTDGKSSDVVSTSADNARAVGITLFAIGIGTGIDQLELQQIGNDPDDKYVFEVNNFDIVENIRSLVSRQACEGTLICYLVSYRNIQGL